MTHVRNPLILMVVALAIFVGCSPTASEPIKTGSFQSVTGRDLRIVTGQTLYVPAYSEVLLGTDRSHQLAVTLAVHNTDLDAPIFLQSVRFYDTDGNIVRNYVEETIEVSPLATTGFLVEVNDTTGGWGSNFVVEWVAEEAVYEPVVEAVMVSRRGAQGFSMISLGRVISQTNVETDETTEEDEE